MNSEEQQYIKGFNHGYMLTKHLPELVARLLKHIKETTSDYIAGFFSGKEEYEFEQSRQQLDQMRELRGKGRNEKNLDMEI